MFNKRSIIVYTAIFGNKNKLSPARYDKNVNFVCFTDDPNIKSNVWNIRVCEPVNDDPCRAAKIYKILPHHYFPHYEYSLWIDGNSELLVDPKTLLSYLDCTDFACFKHPWRNCIYDEAKACIKSNLDSPTIIQNQMKKYRKNGYPANKGLLHAGLLLRRHNNLTIVMNDWWQEISNHSRRDQLSLMYVLHKNNCDYTIIPGCAYDSSPSILRTKEHSRIRKYSQKQKFIPMI
jgi:hypothetical protein